MIRNVPGNVHYDFDWIVYQDAIPSWGAYTYVKLRPNASIGAMVSRLNQEIDLVYPGYSEDVLSKGVEPVPLTEVHFTADTLYELKPIANKAYLSTFGIVGLIILLIIWTNYTNLSIAMYADRQKELGMRKVLGAQSHDISLQLLIEAILMTLLCLPICGMILQFVLPYFNELMDIQLGLSWWSNGQNLLWLLGLLLITGILSGLYPALAYGGRSMLGLFGRKLNARVSNRYFNLRNALITVQFIMVVALLSVTYYIYQQMQYVHNVDLGYQKEGVFYFGVDGAEKYQQLKSALLRLPEVESVGANGVPGEAMFNQSTYKMKDTEVTLSDGTQQYLDYGTIKTLGLKCEACQDLEMGKESIFVINRTAAEKLARIKGVKPEELVGETLITEPEWENEESGFGFPHSIDGIIEDYKFFSLKFPNQSLLVDIVQKPEYVYEMLVRANTENWYPTLQKIESAYKKVEPVRPFDFNFLGERIQRLYNDERRSGILLASLSLVALILALMGLAGIVSYIAFNRQKEMGIRKVHGASFWDILFIFNKEYLILMGVATAIALPMAIYASSRWLESFAYRIEPQVWVVALAGLLALVLVVILVSIQASKAAGKGPMEVLRRD